MLVLTVALITTLFSYLFAVQRPPPARGDSQVGQAVRRSTDSLLLSAAAVRELASRGGVVLLHIGERADYNAGHIPGARFLPYDAISARNPDGLSLELPSPVVLDSLFESLGVSDDSRIVLYWAKDWFSPTTRVFLTLDYLGLGDRTSILDGGFAAWRSSGGPVTRDVPPPARGSLTVSVRSDVVIDASAVRAAIRDSRTAIVDARDVRFFSGEATGMHVREGHVPGAGNLPFTSLFEDRGTFKSREALERLLHRAGATAGKRIVAYCHIGQQASVVYFAARLLGREARLYDGSWEEWSNRPELPVSAGRSRGR